MTHFENLIQDLSLQSEIASKLIEIRIMLMRYAYHYLEKTPDMEDAVQAACKKKLERQCATRIQPSKSCLFHTTENLAHKEIGKSAYQFTDNSEGESTGTDLLQNLSLEEVLEAREKFDLFCRAIQGLPIVYQRVFMLRKVYGFSQAEISDHLGIDIKRVEAHLERSIEYCTEFIEAEE